MSIKLFKFQLKGSIKSLWWWTFSIALFLVFLFAFFPLMEKEQATMDLILKNYPDAMLKILGLSATQSLGSITGYLTFVYIFVHVLVAIYASYVGLKVLADEESNYTSDFLFTLPLSRRKIFISKLFACLVEIIVFWLLVVLITHLNLIVFVGDLSSLQPSFLVLYGSLLGLMLLFFALSLLLTTLKSKNTLSAVHSLSLPLLMYVIYGLDQTLNIKGLSYISFFSYVQLNTILEHHRLDTVYLIMMIILILGSVALSYYGFKQRNLKTR